MRIKKYVFDTNILVSYIITNRQKYLQNIILSESIVIFYCNELLEEFSRVLTYPNLRKYNVDIKEAVNFIKSICLFHELEYPIKNYIPADKADNYIIALALQTNSGFVTSGDDDILSQKENLEKKFEKLRIITKAEFEKRFLNYKL
jgi:uncharacterized protein